MEEDRWTVEWKENVNMGGNSVKATEWEDLDNEGKSMESRGLPRQGHEPI